jgi:hypothetical protein
MTDKADKFREQYNARKKVVFTLYPDAKIRSCMGGTPIDPDSDGAVYVVLGESNRDVHYDEKLTQLHQQWIKAMGIPKMHVPDDHPGLVAQRLQKNFLHLAASGHWNDEVQTAWDSWSGQEDKPETPPG